MTNWLRKQEIRFAGWSKGIVGPIMAANGAITTPLLDRLLNDAENELDALPVLQHALREMWVRRPAFEPLGLPAYEASGGLSKLLSDHAQAVYDKRLSPAEQKIAEMLFRTITRRVSGNRKVRSPSKLQAIMERTAASSSDVVKKVVKTFRAEGLLTTSDSELRPETVIDIPHEALARNWEQLRGWTASEARIRDALEDLERRANRWLSTPSSMTTCTRELKFRRWNACSRRVCKTPRSWGGNSSERANTGKT